nr:MAG TPA: hypothetical protein [Caudoviricetes sp.]
MLTSPSCSSQGHSHDDYVGVINPLLLDTPIMGVSRMYAV